MAAAPHRIRNLIPSKDTARDWTLHDALRAGAVRHHALPDAVDLRAPWWKVGNQGATGSCIGWATADGVMRYLLVKAGRIEPTTLLSPRFIWMAAKEFDSDRRRPETFIEAAGTSLKTAADICRKFGVALHSELPFAIRTAMVVGDPDKFFESVATRKAASYFNARQDLDHWRKALAAGRPILTGLNADSSWDEVPAHGRLEGWQGPGGGHAVCVVGYRRDGRFIIRNSWGRRWGHHGFAYASEDYIRAAFFKEAYVLSV
ncbi:hypothetical protein E2C06_27585 [Dankookia rubra]|uniref:Peptidase C1A papain C-terminal domain-containing protein n=2 Tax=Dankookia rubra TaxID=1442381 RepID=A0A4R5QA34_9PROT|nr:hypothetical protein E2C06_27585 [Dankookia rubra]